MNASAAMIAWSSVVALAFSNPFPQQTPSTTSTGPQITFDTLMYDYGNIPCGSDGRCSFRFTNTGDEPLIIQRFQSSCGCLVPDWDREPVAPKASGTVRLKYDTHRVGPFTKSATVTCNAVDRPVVVLRIKGTVLPDPTSAPHPPKS